MGLDPITSTVIADTVANETGNDPGLATAVTAGPYGPSASQALDGDVAGAAPGAAATTAGVVTGGAGGGAAGGGGSPVWPALISGGSDLLGIVLNNAMKDKEPRPGPIVKNPAYQELMNRYLGIIDAYMQNHGIKPYVAAPATPAAPAQPQSAGAPSAAPAPDANVALAASLGARRLGIKSDAPRVPTTRASFEQSQGQQQQPVNDMYNYIYAARNLGV